MKHLIFIRNSLLLFLLFFGMDYLISQFLLQGAIRYYGLQGNPEILLNGSSMTMAGFNRKDIEKKINKHVASYACEGVSIFDRFEMIKYYFNTNAGNTKTVVYEVNPVIFTKEKAAENVYTLFYPFMDHHTIDSFIKIKAPQKEYLLKKFIRTSRFDARLNRLIVRGYLNKYENLKTNILNPNTIENIAFNGTVQDIPMEYKNIEMFEKTMNFILTNNCNVLLVMMPVYHNKLNSFNKKDYERVCEYFKTYSSSYDKVNYIDLNQDSIIKNNAYFSDPLHFNLKGQKTLTQIISHELTKTF